MKDILRDVLSIVFLPFIVLWIMYQEDKKADELEKIWRENSFVFGNGRYNKKCYKVVDGKIESIDGPRPTEFGYR